MSSYPAWPTQPDYCNRCGVNVTLNTLPTGWPMRKEIIGNFSKALYTGIPNYYPYLYRYKPVGTLYDNYFGDNRHPRQQKMFPFTDRNVKEKQEYAPYILPYPDIREWTKHPVEIAGVNYRPPKN